MNLTTWLSENKNWLEAVAAIIGFVGGVLGFVSLFFSYSDYHLKHIQDPNKIIWENCLRLTYNECFNAQEPNLPNNHDFEKIYGLTSLIIAFDKNGNKFHGIRTRRILKKVLSNAQNLDKKFDQFTPFAMIHGSASENAILEYRKAESEIKELQKSYKELYQHIHGFISPVDDNENDEIF